MAWVKFLVDREVRRGDGSLRRAFTAGEVVELAEGSARRWIRRGLAEPVAEPVAAPEAVAVAEEAEAPAEPEAVEPTAEPAPARQVVERGGGWFDVIDGEGRVLNELALRRDEADALAAEEA